MSVEYPFIIVVTKRYLIWESDWDDAGPEVMLQRFIGEGDYYELIPPSAFDSWLDIELAEPYDLAASGETDCRYPLPRCAEPGCTNLLYYPIGMNGDRCPTHRKASVQA